MIRETIMAMIPFEQRAHSRFLTPLEAETLAGIEQAKATRIAYRNAQGRGK